MTEIELPDGTVLELPAGASPDQIRQAVRKHAARTAGQAAPAAQTAPPAASEPAPATFERAAGGGPVRAGVADAAIKGYLGLKSFVGGLDKDEQGVLAQMKKESDADPEGRWRTAGDIGGNVLMTALPGVGVGKAALLPKLAKTIAARSSPAAGAIGAGAAVSGAQSLALTPGEGESFGEQMTNKAKAAITDSALGGAFSAGGQVLKKWATKMFTPTAEAQTLFDQGVNPTLQQGADNWFGRAVGGMSSGAARTKQRQDREILESFVKQYVAPGLDVGEMKLSEINALANQLITADRNGILGDKTFKLGNPERIAVLRAMSGPAGTQRDVTAEALKSFPALGDAMQSTNPVRMGYGRFNDIRGRFQDAINSQPGNDRVSIVAKQNLIKAKDKFDELVRDPALSPDEALHLATNDQQYKYFKRLQEASETAASHKNLRVEHLTQQFAEKAKDSGVPQQFAEMDDPALKHLLEPAMRVIGETPNQNQWRAAFTTAKRAAMPVAATAGALSGGPAMALAPLYGLSLAGQFAKPSRLMFGQEEWQKALAKYLTNIEPYTASAGFALTPEN